MKLKASLFNRSIILEDLKRFWGISILYTIVLFLNSILPILLSYDTLTRHGDYIVSEILKGNTFFNYLFLITAPLVTAVLIFRYMQQNHSTAVIHAFPFTRKQLFVNHCISGIVLLLIPIIFNSSILLLIKKPVYLGIGADTVNIFTTQAIGQLALQSTLIVLVGFSIAVFAGIISGTSILQTIFGFGFLFIVPATFVIFIGYFDRFLFGFSTTPKFIHFVGSISPIIAKLDSYNNFSNINWMVWYIALTIILLTVSYLLYSKRKLECATEPIVFDLLKPIFKYSVAFCGMTILGLYFMDLGQNKTLSLYLGFFIGSIICYIIAEMIVQKSIWVFKNLKGYLYFLIIAVIFIVCIETDILGYENRLPDINKVESIYIGNSSYQMDEENQQFLTTPENIDLAYLYHQSILDNKDALEEYDYTGYTQSVCIGYNCKNGKKLIRQYRLPQEFIIQNLYMKEIFESEEYKLTTQPIFNIDVNHIDFLDIQPRMNAYDNTPIRIAENNEIQSFVNALKEDILNETYEEYYDSLLDLGHVRLVLKDPKKKDVDIIYDDPYLAGVSSNARILKPSFIIKPTYFLTIEWLESHNYLDNLLVTPDEVSSITVTRYLEDGDMKYDRYTVEYNPSTIPESTDTHMVITDKEDIQTILSTLEKRPNYKKSHYAVSIMFNHGESRHNGGYYRIETAPEFIKNYFD